MRQFVIKIDFDLQGWLDSCRASGVKLYAATEGEAVDGFMSASGQHLEVTLSDSANWAIVNQKITEFNAA
jgi:hypothetical protein